MTHWTHALHRATVRFLARWRNKVAAWRAPGAAPSAGDDPARIAHFVRVQTALRARRTGRDALDALCAEALAVHPGHPALTAAAARWYLAAGRADEARLVCEAAFGQNAAHIGHDHGVQSAWGEALLALRRTREAVWRLEAACAGAEATPDDWAHLAQACSRCGRYDRALTAAEKALERPWTHPDAAEGAAVAMATAQYCLGRMAESEQTLLNVLARAPYQPEARRLLTKVRNFTGKGMQT